MEHGNDGEPIAWIGNNLPLGIKHRITFTSKLFTYMPGVYPCDDPNDPRAPRCGALAHFLYVQSHWGNRDRGIFIALAHWRKPWSNSTTPTHTHWNWPITNSMYSPGSDNIYIDAEDVHSICPTVANVPRLLTQTQQVNYNIDLNALFCCLSDIPGSYGFDQPMPLTGSFPIHHVEWINELTGTGSLFTSVHNMRTL